MVLLRLSQEAPVRFRFPLVLLFSFAALLAMPKPAAGAPPIPRTMAREMVSFAAANLTSAAINAACAADVGSTDAPLCASFEVKTQGYRELVLNIRYLKGTLGNLGAATAVLLYVDGSQEADSGDLGNVPWGARQVGDLVAPPVETMADWVKSWNVAAIAGAGVATWEVVIPVKAPYTRIRIVGTAANANDKVTVRSTLIGS
jgi:hypothetical protein